MILQSMGIKEEDPCHKGGGLKVMVIQQEFPRDIERKFQSMVTVQSRFGSTPEVLDRRLLLCDTKLMSREKLVVILR